MQEKLGIGADGKFGSGTAKADKAYQEENGLKADGIVGPDALAKLNLFEDASAEQVLASATGPVENIWDTLEAAAEGALGRVKSMFGF